MKSGLPSVLASISAGEFRRKAVTGEFEGEVRRDLVPAQEAQDQLPAEPAPIEAKTEGSPLFMVDLVRYLRDRGVIRSDDGRWVLAETMPDLARALPESVRGMIERRIAQLDEADRALLVAASVQGDEFDSAVVAKAMGLEPAEVEDRLDRPAHTRRAHARNPL